MQAVARAGRTVIFAGTALAVGMLGALMIAPGALLESATFGVIVACVLAVAAALFAIPAGLAVLGTNVDRWQLWSARRENPWVRLSERRLEQAGCRGGACDLPAAAPVDSRARARHRTAERREPAPGQRGAQELRGLRARPRRGLGDAVRGHLPHDRADHDRAAPARAEALPARGRARAGRRGGARAGVAARPHRRAAPAHSPDRDRRPAAERSSSAACGACCIGTGRLHRRPPAGRPRARTSSRTGSARPRAAPGSSPRARAGGVPQTQRLAQGVSQTGAGRAPALTAPRQRANRGSQKLLDAMRTLTRVARRRRTGTRTASSPNPLGQRAIRPSSRRCGTSAAPAPRPPPTRPSRAPSRTSRRRSPQLGPLRSQPRRLRDRVRRPTRSRRGRSCAGCRGSRPASPRSRAAAAASTAGIAQTASGAASSPTASAA